MLPVMMSISELQRLANTTDPAWRSPIADRAAARWGYPTGKARWWRSSGTHVFVLPGQGGDASSDRFLRFVPDRHRAEAQVRAVAELMRDLARAGARVVVVEPSLAGDVVESVDTELGLMHAMVVRRAPGELIEADGLTVTRARAWGSALAQLHAHAAGSGEGLPETYAGLRADAETVVDDSELCGAIGGIADVLEALPRDPSWFGVGHGDFELDNMAWVDDVPTAFDFDNAGTTWYVADIANAVRDLTSMGRATDPYRDRFDAFVAGYRGRRSLPAEQLDLLPLFAAAGIADRLMDLRRALVVDATVGPESASLAGVRTRLAAVAVRDRQNLLNATW